MLDQNYCAFKLVDCLHAIILEVRSSLWRSGAWRVAEWSGVSEHKQPYYGATTPCCGATGPSESQLAATPPRPASRAGLADKVLIGHADGLCCPIAPFLFPVQQPAAAAPRGAPFSRNDAAPRPGRTVPAPRPAPPRAAALLPPNY